METNTYNRYELADLSHAAAACNHAAILFAHVAKTFGFSRTVGAYQHADAAGYAEDGTRRGRLVRMMFVEAWMAHRDAYRKQAK